MNVRAGTQVKIREAFWPDATILSPDERTPQNALWRPVVLLSRGPEWIGPHQRMVVRFASHRGELFLTLHELEINGAIEQ